MNAFGNRSNLDVTDTTGSFDHAWVFDEFNRLVEAALPADPTPGDSTLALLYLGNDDLEQITHGNSATTDYTYHLEGPIDQITVNGAVPSPLHALDYGVDAVLNIDALSETRGAGPAESYSYGYDGVSRLTSADYPAAFGLPADDAYAYDAAGNRDNASSPGDFSYDGNNRITQSTLASALRSYVFDADGNLEAITDGEPTPTTLVDLTFDYTNRLQTYAEVGGDTTQYRYDPFGRRIQKIGASATTLYLWDGDQLLGEYTASGDRKVRYAYAGGLSPVQVAYEDGMGGEAIYEVHTDHLDTPKLLTDATGAVAWRAAHEAYGTAVLDPGNTLVEVFNIRFPGQYYDAETGLHYNRFRYHDPGIGRYITADPVGQFGSIMLAGATPNLFMRPHGVAPRLIDLLSADPNLYAFGSNDPIYTIDPLGLYSAWEVALDAGNFATGVADAASLGLGPLARSYLEENFGAGGYVDECSTAYSAGTLASLALGAGRLAYAGAAKAISRFASSGAAASAARNTLKRVFRGGAFASYRTGSRAAQYASDDALRAAAGRTNPGYNAAGANAAIGGGVNAACGCDQAR